MLSSNGLNDHLSTRHVDIARKLEDLRHGAEVQGDEQLLPFVFPDVGEDILVIKVDVSEASVRLAEALVSDWRS